MRDYANLIKKLLTFCNKTCPYHSPRRSGGSYSDTCELTWNCFIPSYLELSWLSPI